MGGRGASSASGALEKQNVGFTPATNETQALHAERIKILDSDEYPDGTYDLDTMRLVDDYKTGYQVTFYQIGDDYTPEEYADKVNEFLAASSDGIVSAGKFEGTPEISFNVTSLDEAIALAKKYNQKSIWDNANMTLIDTGGTGRRD